MLHDGFHSFCTPDQKKIGAKRTILIGALCYGGGILCTGFVVQLWQLYLFYGIFNGIGSGFIYPNVMTYISRLFPGRSGMASGLGTGAYGAGAVIWAPVATLLIESVSMNRAFYIIGIAFLLVIAVCSLLLKEPPENFHEELCMEMIHSNIVEIDTDLSRIQMVKTIRFYQILLIFTFGLVSGTIVISQASPILQQICDFTPSVAAMAVSIFSACNMAGRFLWGNVSDRLGVRTTLTVIFIPDVVSMLLPVFFGGTVSILAAMALAASCYGGFASLLTPITLQMFGAKHLTENYGVVFIVYGFASLIGPNLATWANSSGEGYYKAFLIASVLSATGFILSIFLKSKRKEPQ